MKERSWADKAAGRQAGVDGMQGVQGNGGQVEQGRGIAGRCQRV